MSIENLIVWQGEGVPSIADVNIKCGQLGYAVEFDHSVRLTEHTGYLPAKHDGHKSGFEFYFLPKGSPDLTSLDEFFSQSQGVMSVTRGNFREAAVALMFLHAIAEITDGGYLDLSFDIMKSNFDAPEYLKSAIDGCLSELEIEERKASERLERQKARRPDADKAMPENRSELPKISKIKRLWSRLFGADK